MQCKTHPEISGVNTCNQCGEWLCEGCTVEINGRIFCRKCLSQLAGGPEASRAEAPRAAYGETTAIHPSRRISGGLLFVFSFLLPVPGVNYMYMGLIKRGLAAMASFFLLIYMVSVFNNEALALIFGLAIPVLWITCFFDGFNLRRRINAGETVYDDIADINAFFRRNKSAVIGVTVTLLALGIAAPVFSWLPRFFGRGLPIAVILLGLYFLFQRPKR